MKKPSVKYVDGYVITIPKKNLKLYKKMATYGRDTWMKHGALDYKECILEDGKPQHVALTFEKLVKAKSTDTVIFSYIGYKSRKHRDAVNAKVMKDPSMNQEQWKDQKMPFDMKRFSYAGFNVIVSN